MCSRFKMIIFESEEVRMISEGEPGGDWVNTK